MNGPRRPRDDEGAACPRRPRDDEGAACPRRPRDDEGAALLIALGFIAFFGVVIAAILGFADTSLRATDRFERQRDEVFAADGAVEKTIADMRSNALAGKYTGGTGCGQTVTGLNGLTVDVACTADPTSGEGGGAGGAGDAIITTATGAEYGIYRDANGEMLADGNIRANSTIKLGGGGTIKANGAVTAFGSCDSGVSTATGTPQCNTNTLTTVPTYSSATIVTAPGSRTNCTLPSTIVKFSPGTYTSAAALTSVMATASLCTKSLFYFSPGVYYFNFAAGDDEWVIDDANVNIIGGAPGAGLTIPSNDAAPTTPKPVAIAFPGGCDKTVSGVQFVFSGASRVRLDAGTVELCPVLGSGPPISIYGATNVLKSATLTPTGSTGLVKFSNGPGAYTIGDGGTATAGLTRNQSGSITLNSFVLSPVTPIPSDAVITSAALRVAHQEGNGGGPNNNADLDVSASRSFVKLVKGGGASCSFGLAKKVNLATESFDVTSCVTSGADLTGLTASYAVAVPDQNNKALDDFLDGVALDVSYTTAGIAPQTGCIIEPNFPTGGADATHCALLRVSGSSSDIAVHGMIYAPRAALDLNQASGSDQGYLYGIVIRAFRANLTPSTPFPAAIKVPAPTSGAPNDRLVELVATINGDPKLRATVQFQDQPSAGTTVTLKRWTVVR